MPTYSPRRTVRAGASLLLKVAAAALSAALLAGCSSGDAGSSTSNVEYEFTGVTPRGQVIAPANRAASPTFNGELLDGASFDSAKLAGDVAVINFWGSWCGPCRVETPDLQTVHADLGDRGVQFLGVDVKDDRQLAIAFMDQVGAEYPSLFDPRGEVAMAFRGFPANAVPSTILIDRDGGVAAVYTGAITQDDLRQALSTLLAEEGP
ncbi:TlpA family protein disulfide reductase [Candidatus Blastococcus massiliensis]|uniref:TlpA family protein disulfide reductase n=1 Tax=Candidatus Blastococcus massiliensis TaxID=1470358 RepID=UPI0004AD7C85|nr:TlpA disulfide reductase family protein [Candidatus Blastococcus massiliensis]